MALDPRISLGVQPMQMPDPLAQYGKIAALQQAQNQNALAQYQLGAAQRADEQAQNRLRLFQEAGGDPGKVANALLRSGDWEGYTKLTKGEAETGDLRAKTIAKHMELSKERLSSVRTPEDYLAWHQANHADPVLAAYFQPMGITSESQTPKIIEQLGQPGGFEALFKQSALGLDKAMEQVLTSQNLGGTARVISTPKYALPGTAPKATVVPGSAAQVTMTPDAAAADARARQDLAFRVSQASPEAIQARAKAEAQGRAAGEGDGILKATEGERKAATLLGILQNAEVVIDTVSGKKSQPGPLSSAVPSALKNEDRQRMEAAQLDFLDAALTLSTGAAYTKEQLEGKVKTYFPQYGDKKETLADKAKRRKELVEMARIAAGRAAGAIKQPTPKPEPGGVDVGKPPAGIDSALWNVMTPQERALWQK